MRYRLRPEFWLIAALVPALALGACLGNSAREANDGLDVYFRDVNLHALSDQDLPEYPDSDAGDSSLIARDFPDAPPQIPHTVEDMLPIAREDNECLECHHPDNAVGGDDVPLPESHFMVPVMGKGAAHDPMLWVVKDYQKIQDVMGGRFNCTMCHTTQATNVSTPENAFAPARH